MTTPQTAASAPRDLDALSPNSNTQAAVTQRTSTASARLRPIIGRRHVLTPKSSFSPKALVAARS